MKGLLSQVIGRFAAARVAVLGDLVLDEFLHGEIARVSREAPVLIIDYLRTDAMPGGAANAVNNVRALSGRAVPVGVVGDDEAGHRLTDLLEESGVDTSHVSRLAGYATPVKSRVLAGLPHSRPQQVIRIDRGSTSSVPPETAAAAAEQAGGLLADGGVDALLISDYGYGLATPASSASLLLEARRRKITVTCDSRHRLAGFRGVTAATPNLEEAEQIAGRRLQEGGAPVTEAGRRLLESLDCKAVLITRGSHGMTLVEDGVRTIDIPAFGSGEVADVTGAGDTVIATFSLALAAKATFRAAAILANCAAGLVVMKRGTATVTPAELTAAIGRMEPESAE